MFRWAVFATIVFIFSFVVGLRWGVEGVATAYAIATYLLAYPAFAVAFRLIDLKVRHFLTQLWSIMLATLALAITTFIIRIALERPGVTQDAIILGIVTVASVLSYSVFVFILDRELFTGTLRLLSELKGSRGKLTED
jgi:hypothetical protein